jgi:hypothetical protein
MLTRTLISRYRDSLDESNTTKIGGEDSHRPSCPKYFVDSERVFGVTVAWFLFSGTRFDQLSYGREYSITLADRDFLLAFGFQSRVRSQWQPVLRAPISRR